MEQQQSSNSAKRSGLLSSLRDLANNITVDIWGIEKKVNQHLSQFFCKEATKENLSANSFALNIARPGQNVHVTLCSQDKVLHEIPIKALSELFGIPTAFQLLPEVIEERIANYLNILAQANNVKTTSLNICLSLLGERVVLRLYNKKSFLMEIQFSGLLKYFQA